MKPDCQELYLNGKLGDLPFYGVYCPIKNTNLSVTELLRLRQHYADGVLNEHFMAMYFMERVCDALTSHNFDEVDAAVTRDFIENSFLKRLRRCGWKGEDYLAPNASIIACLQFMAKICEGLYADVLAYLKQISPDRIPEYQGPLCGYLDFIHPVLRDLRRLPFMPKGPIFLLIDDADNLNRTQTVIINSWVATRTSNDVSLKISTQLGYKTYKTISGQYIDRTHDYTEVYIDTIYTTNHSKYQERVRDIIEKRLNSAGIHVDVDKFFPPDEAQEAAIRALEAQFIAQHPTEGRGTRPRDDALRYARPTYIANLKGISKSGSTYSYAGFNQLVHLSSGLIRYFLEPAALMFSQQASDVSPEPVTYIKPHIQDATVKKEANSLLFEEMDKLLTEEASEDETYVRVNKLANLIHNLGGLFHLRLVSQAAERRVFSIALTDPPDEEISAVLALGVRQGYLQRTSLGNKDGTGRTARYILTRRLAPAFLLDPSSFAGYQWVPNEYLRAAMRDRKILKRIKERGGTNFEDFHPEFDFVD